MAKRRKKQYSIGNSSRGQLGLGRRSMFVSQEKQAQHQAARRLKVWSRVVASILIVGLLGMAGVFAWFVIVPYLHQEIVKPVSGVPGSPGATAEPLPEYDSLGLPEYGNEVSLFTINQSSPVTADYKPESLVSVENIQVDDRIVDALRQLTSAAKDEGLVLVFAEGFVSYEEQERRYNLRVDELREDGTRTVVMAKTVARATTPMAGESDFQTGMCLRLVGDPATFPQSKTYSWLKTNMGRYGFVFRYPEGKKDYTGVTPDLTVLRYVGGKNAAAMQQRSMCLEEYRSNLELD